VLSHAQAKRQAAQRAAALIERGDTIFIDCGTTMPHLVASLPSSLEITIVCYALNIAAGASQLAGTRLFLLGGLFHPSSATFSSDEALRSLQRIGINKAFLSAGGLHETRGASCSNFNEVPVKRAVLDQAERSFLVIDSSKLGRVKPAHFAPADAFEQIITEL
jgi:DeoR family deoxyribose operon repressor